MFGLGKSVEESRELRGSAETSRNSTIEALLEVVFFRVSDRRFIGEIAFSLQLVLGGRFVVEEDPNV
jgi:hypothetical protein